MQATEQFEPKVLVISHIPFDLQNNMGRTLTNLFCSWKPENLAQFYLYNKAPNSEICYTYYRTTDFDMLKSVFLFKSKNVIPPTAELTNATEMQKNVYGIARSRKPYQYIARNYIWKSGAWYTDELKKWISQFNPDVVFYAAGGYSFSYIIAEKISKEYNLPLIPYFCDDYYFLNMYPYSALYKHVRKDIRGTIKRVIENSPTFVCISDEMKKAYSEEFDSTGRVVMNGSATVLTSADEGRARFDYENPFVIRYLGRLGLGRAEALKKLGKGIKNTGLPIKIQVFSTETAKNLLEGMSEENGIEFMGAVSPDAIFQTMRQADALLHIESYDPQMIERTKYSISTKIPDMLASGVCSIAAGPDNVASINYLKNAKAAHIIDMEAIEKSNLEMLFSPEYRQKLISNAATLAKQNHNARANSETLKQEIIKVLQ